MTATLSFDVTGLTLQNINRTRRTELPSAFLFYLLGKVIGIAYAINPTLSSKAISKGLSFLVGRQAEKLAQRVVWYEGAAAHLEREIAATGVLPPHDFIRKIDDYAAQIAIHRGKTTELLDQIYSVKQISGVGDSLTLVLKRIDQLAVAINSMRFVATGQALEVAQQREIFLQLREKIQGHDDSDIDPELLELAARADSAAASRNLAADPDWARRMTQGPSH